VKLVACPDCHAQYDVTLVAADSFTCRCGRKLENRALPAVDARILRCAACGAQVAEGAADCAYCGAAVVREPDPHSVSLICPECYARNADTSRFCTACGVAFRPEPIPEAGPELACPACACPMQATHVADVAVCECPQCHGLWVPGSRFDELVRRATEAHRKAGSSAAPPRVHGGNPNARPVRYRRCPSCSSFMLRRNFRRSSGVVIDLCRAHGTWLDADEIEQIAGFILSGAEALAAAARLRCASEATAQNAIFGRSAGPQRTSLLGLLFDILR
jgi:Zn-finger nucleic acid-binding protein